MFATRHGFHRASADGYQNQRRGTAPRVDDGGNDDGVVAEGSLTSLDSDHAFYAAFPEIRHRSTPTPTCHRTGAGLRPDNAPGIYANIVRATPITGMPTEDEVTGIREKHRRVIVRRFRDPTLRRSPACLWRNNPCKRVRMIGTTTREEIAHGVPHIFPEPGRHGTPVPAARGITSANTGRTPITATVTRIRPARAGQVRTRPEVQRHRVSAPWKVQSQQPCSPSGIRYERHGMPTSSHLVLRLSAKR